MAASIVGGRVRLFAPPVVSKVLKCSNRYYARGPGLYYVLLPEIPPDTPETNPVMRISDYPQFSCIQPDKVVTGCAKLAIEFDVQLGKHAENLKDGKYTKTFNSVFDHIEQFLVPLTCAWRTAKHLNYVCTSDGYRAAFNRIHPQVERAKNERWTSLALYHAVKEVSGNRSGLTEFQCRLIDMYLLEARLNGIELFGEDRKKFMTFLKKMIDSRSQFRNRVMLSHNLFSHTIEDFATMAEMPKSLLSAVAVDKSHPGRGPWNITLNQNVYQPFMEFCGDRVTRWNVWLAYNSRSSIGQDELNLSNHITIEDIRLHRRDLANCLGYKNFAEMSMETKMAKSVETVLGFISSLKAHLQPLAEQELSELQKFARSEGFTDQLQMWDIPYWRRRHRQHLFKVDGACVAEYFPYPHVFVAMLELCGRLFNIEFKECTQDVDVWHETVKFYKVLDKTDHSHIASFYIDAYSRPGHKLSGSWMECGRDKSTLLSTTPISYFNLCLNPPVGNLPSLFSFEQVKSMFFEFGHGLQQMLTKVPYSEITGQRNIEWDSLQTCANVIQMLFLDKHTIQNVSRHYQTGQKLSEDAVDALLKTVNHMSAYDAMRQLYFSAYDMELCISTEHWSRVMTRMWKQYTSIPLNDDDTHPCSLTPIFSDQYPGAYYSLLWSQMLAADIVEAFHEVGLQNTEEIGAVGKRFRNTYLSLGGGVPAGEVFRRFRNREPSTDALIARYEHHHDS